jgi:hypothetical protein
MINRTSLAPIGLNRSLARFFTRCHLNDQESCLLVEVKALDGPKQDCL